MGAPVERLKPSTAEEIAAQEAQRIRRRRAELGIPETRLVGSSFWGLAISGGGIRSATFGLGVLQALARVPAPEGADGKERGRLLRLFDYLSTVSGGGYIGAFFGSLFIPGRVSPNDATAPQAAVRAYEVLQDDPPGRIRSRVPFDAARPQAHALAWLRENGRYLTPTGAGDFLYVIALQIRSWLALHYVLGVLLLGVLSLIALAKEGLHFGLLATASCKSFCDPSALRGWPELWWSSFWLLPGAQLFLVMAPLGIGYWMAHEKPGDRRTTSAMWASLFTSLLFLGLSWPARQQGFKALGTLLATLGSVTLLAVWYHLRAVGRTQSVTAQRVAMTRGLAKAFAWSLALAAIASLDTLAQTAYLYIKQGESNIGAYLSPAAVIGVAVWLVRKAAALSSEREAPAWLKKLPLGALAGIAGALLLLTIAMLWALAVQWLLWFGAAPVPADAGTDLALQALWAALLAALFLGLAAMAGRFPGFINLSTLQNFYAARLTRAYLGASNALRFLADRRSRSVAEPHSLDGITRAQYFDERWLGPLHLINATMNQTVDPAEQLVQRDRKGKPLAIGPAGYLLDGGGYAFRDVGETFGVDLDLGQWIGVSGAAVTTGLGRTTSLGLSILLGLSNVRLGTWWRAERIGGNDATGFEAASLRFFKTQTYLLYELSAHFCGDHRPWQYLSDGGHFENTALYELLRPQRDVRIAVVSDNGCDPSYQFGDLANLIRLARIDFKAEVEVDAAIAAAEGLRDVFGVESDFRSARPGESPRCALLLKVTYPDVREARTRFVIVLKPCLVKGAPLDVAEYRLRFGDFPQQSTLDQFFDEAQWESYRKLGLEIGQRVFGGANGAKLWAYLEEQIAAGAGKAAEIK